MEIGDDERAKRRKMQPHKLHAALIRQEMRKPSGKSMRNAMGRESRRKKMEP